MGFWKRFWKRVRRESGATGTEYMLIVSVVTVATGAVSYTFVPTFRDGTNALAGDVSQILVTHRIGDVGMGAPNGAGTQTAGTSNSSNPNSGTNDSNSSVASNPTINAPGASTNCSGGGGGMVSTVSCSGQTAGVGGGEGNGATADANGVSATTVAQLQDGTAADRARAEKDVASRIAKGDMRVCSQYFLSGITGKSLKDTVVDTLQQNLTQADYKQTQINLPWLGSFQFGSQTPHDFKGYMSLAQMQSYLNTQNITSTVAQNQSVGDLRTSLEAGNTVGAIIDVGRDGKPTSSCDGKCGHTVEVIWANSDTVWYWDTEGLHEAGASDFTNAWKPHGQGDISVPPRGSSYAANP